MRELFTLSASDIDFVPSGPILFTNCDHYYWGKEENNIPPRWSVVRVLFTLSESDNDFAPSDPILLSNCNHYYWGRRDQHTVKIKCCESVV